MMDKPKGSFQLLIRSFSRGLGLKILLSFVPPVLLAWLFFILYCLELRDHGGQGLNAALGWGLTAIGLGSLAVVWLILSVIPPFRRCIDVVNALASGHTETEFPPFGHRADEIGELARGVGVLGKATEENARLRLDQERVRIESEAERKRSLLTMAEGVDNEIRAMMGDISSLTEAMGRDALELFLVSEKTSDGASSAASAAVQAMGNAQTVAGASEELHASIAEIASQVGQSKDLVARAVDSTQVARGIVDGLTEAAKKVGSIVELINDIAGQTNLLALNATIEAARAGDAGKGFAVVANEVKGLATQTQRATSEISRQINDIQVVAKDAIAATLNVQEAIRYVEGASTAIAAAVEEQSASTSEIARTVGQTALAANKVSGLMGGLVDASGQGRSLSSDVSKDVVRVTDTLMGISRALTRVVRSSTPETDRRHEPRYGTLLSVSISSGGTQCAAVATNVSVSGLSLHAEGNALANGSRVDVSCGELRRGRSGIVVQGGDILHIKLDHNDHLEGDLVAHLASSGAKAVIERAKQDHLKFVENIEGILAGHSKGKACDLANHHTCRLGKWYDSVTDQRIIAGASFKALVEPHGRVHAAGKEAVTLFWAGNRHGADESFARLKAASGEVIGLLDRLGGEILTE